MAEKDRKDELEESGKAETTQDVILSSAPESAAETSSAPAAEQAKKSFVHTTAFKCIVVLLIIVIVCGVFLTICNALFYVSDQERTDRAAKKIYGEEVTTVTEEVNKDLDVGNATINLVYTIEEYPDDYLINVTGKGGYSGGTVTCYVVITVTDGEISVGNISVSENTSQSLISNVKSGYLEGFSELYGNEVDETDEYYMLWSETDGFYVKKPGSVNGAHLTTGATYTMQAICNAVNGAVSYVEQEYLNIEKEATQYDDYLYIDYINTSKTKHSVDGSTVTFTVVTSGYINASPFTVEIVVDESETIVSFTILDDGSSQAMSEGDKAAMETKYIGLTLDGVLECVTSEGVLIKNSTLYTGATESGTLVANAALFALANYETALGGGQS
ncbi:MAG: hypothetical protein LUD47_01735 [Clostridia bacterium]|nr:hypothetical protein [Clostridia bacterium]